MKQKNSYEEDDEEMSMSPKSSLLRESKKDDNAADIPFCGCLSIKFYQPYFDLDTRDVLNRSWSALVFCGRQETFLEQFSLKSPDGYGPFWVRIRAYALELVTVIVTFSLCLSVSVSVSITVSVCLSVCLSLCL
jgi:hypothetical protein